MSPAAKTPPRVDTTRTYADHVTVNGHEVKRGDEVTVAGIRGRCTFVAHVTHESGTEWVDVLNKAGRSRSVRPDAVTRYHRTRRAWVAVSA